MSEMSRDTVQEMLKVGSLKRFFSLSASVCVCVCTNIDTCVLLAFCDAIPYVTLLHDQKEQNKRGGIM